MKEKEEKARHEAGCCEELDSVESTLFVPMQGRIYASERFPKIFYDEKALELKQKLPEKFKGKNRQNQYSYMAGAIRSVIFDDYIENFLKRHKDGIIVQLGCGLETCYFRHNDKGVWYSLDLPETMRFRKEILPAGKNETLVMADVMDFKWLRDIRKKHQKAPMLVLASGFFYYFDYDQVLEIFHRLQQYGNTEVIFDAISPVGIKFTALYMKAMGHGDAKLRFNVGKPEALLEAIGGDAKILMNRDRYYGDIDRTGMNLNTRFNMWGNDLFKMTKVIAIAL